MWQNYLVKSNYFIFCVELNSTWWKKEFTKKKNLKIMQIHMLISVHILPGCTVQLDQPTTGPLVPVHVDSGLRQHPDAVLHGYRHWQRRCWRTWTCQRMMRRIGFRLERAGGWCQARGWSTRDGLGFEFFPPELQWERKKRNGCFLFFFSCAGNRKRTESFGGYPTSSQILKQLWIKGLISRWTITWSNVRRS